MPLEIGNLVNLLRLYLNGNQFSGEIHQEIWSLVRLNYLNLKYKEFIGEIPVDIGSFNNMIGLSLANNQLSGEIPVSICNLVENDCYLYVDNNQLCPPYPECIEEDIGSQDTSECVDCPDLAGDTNNDGQVNILDIVLLVNCILMEECGLDGDCLDINLDDEINILDIVFIVNMILEI